MKFIHIFEQENLKYWKNQRLSSYFLLLYYSSSSSISFSAFSFSSFILLSLDLSSVRPFFTLRAAEVEAFCYVYSL
jgi:hypothetical protein